MTVVDPIAEGSHTSAGHDPSRVSVRGVRLDTADPLIGGVASGAARRLGASPLVVRVGFAILGLAGGVGVGLYLVLKVVGIGAPQSPRARTLRHDVGIVSLTAAALVVVFTLVPSVSAELLGPLAFVSFALAFSAGSSIGPDLRSGRAFGRIAAGLVLMFGGLAAGMAMLGDLGQIWVAGAATGAVAVGGGVVLAPWIRHLLDGASADRIERIRAEERADIAAHLHDSVLQTLTLIQNRAHEPQVASALAYQQERELRRWLYRRATSEAADSQIVEATMRTQLGDIAAGVEDDYLVVIDFVCVGDTAVNTTVSALMGAVREALVNAAKFAQTQQISLYTEVREHQVIAFVRDRGVGFDLAAVGSDRRGIADSIRNRVERLGGTAVIRSSVGVGTEVRIEVPCP